MIKLANPGKPVSLAKAQKHARDLLNDVARAHAGGKHAQALRATRAYLASFDARYLAVVEANKKLKQHKRAPKGSLAAIAHSLNAFNGSQEKATAHWKPKSADGDFRVVLDFGIEQRALQELVSQVLKVQSETHPHQFAVRGGKEAAIQLAAKALEAGYAYVIETDITDCYPSFNQSKVMDLLPLPKEVSKKVIISKELPIKIGNHPLNGIGPDGVESIAEAQQGLPQGSSASPFVVEVLLAPVLSQLPEGGLVVAYADNFLVMAQDANGAAATSLALGSALTSHPAGPLWPKLPKMYAPGQAIEFLGYRLQIKNGKCRISPSARNMQKFEDKFKRALRRITKAPTVSMRHVYIRKAVDYTRSWCAGFGLWHEAHGHQTWCKAEINKLAATLGIPGVS